MLKYNEMTVIKELVGISIYSLPMQTDIKAASMPILVSVYRYITTNYNVTE